MNINYINESVISVAVMRRKRTHTQARTQGQQGEGSVWKMFVVFLQSRASPSPALRNWQMISE